MHHAGRKYFKKCRKKHQRDLVKKRVDRGHTCQQITCARASAFLEFPTACACLAALWQSTNIKDRYSMHLWQHHRNWAILGETRMDGSADPGTEGFVLG